jgi:aminopeptidase N
MQKLILLILSSFVFLISCSKTKDLTIKDDTDWEVSFLDTLTITPEEDIVEEDKYYNPSYSRAFDLLHTKLEVAFDWAERSVLGKAELSMTPVFYPQDYVILDAKGFDIKKISSGEVNLDFEYDGYELLVILQNEITRADTITLFIEYIAKPEKGNGSAAITSDKGLFFINPDGDDPSKPSQIWTQGETENNSKWFPTIDKPNERCTQDISIVVDKKYQTISNGNLISSTENIDGTRTDRWVQDKPHAPYLFMLAVGDFGLQSEKWNGKDLNYYVDKDYEKYAKKIFDHTPEMLDFFSNVLNYEYPWDKYSQVIVKDFVSGAMENTSAVIFGDFVQKDSKALVDNGNDAIVAHEMFHHWFGDLVTCESWANLTLNEGFANYSEYLWMEYKYGLEKAEEHRLNEMMAYFYSTQGDNTHPLIHFYYDDKEQMFDAHSYNKGGLVLHMLRKMIGDEAFFASLNKYLIDNQYSAVEVDELRMAFEDTIGEDLNWFFNQWYLSEGHPIISYDYNYSSEFQQTTININQIQNPEAHLSAYVLPMEIEVYYEDGSIETFDIIIDEREMSFPIKSTKKPILIIIDSRGDLLIELRQDYTQEELISIYNYCPIFKYKIKALQNIDETNYSPSIIDKGLNEDFYAFRREIIENIDEKKIPVYIEKLKTLAKADPHSQVREAAIDKLPIAFDKGLEPILEQVIMHDESYSPINAAIEKLSQLDLERAIKAANILEDIRDSKLILTLSRIYSANPTVDYSGFYTEKSKYVNFFHSTAYYGNLGKYLEKTNQSVVLDVYKGLSPIYWQKSDVMTRLQIINLFNKEIYLENEEINEARTNFYNELKAKETNSFLLSKCK